MASAPPAHSKLNSLFAYKPNRLKAHSSPPHARHNSRVNNPSPIASSASAPVVSSKLPHWITPKRSRNSRPKHPHKIVRCSHHKASHLTHSHQSCPRVPRSTKSPHIKDLQSIQSPNHSPITPLYLSPPCPHNKHWANHQLRVAAKHSIFNNATRNHQPSLSKKTHSPSYPPGNTPPSFVPRPPAPPPRRPHLPPISNASKPGLPPIAHALKTTSKISKRVPTRAVKKLPTIIYKHHPPHVAHIQSPASRTSKRVPHVSTKHANRSKIS